jgi:hypothetical protein
MAGYAQSFTDLYSYNPRTDEWTEVSASFPTTGGLAWPSVAVLGSTAFIGSGAVFPSFSFKNVWYSFTAPEQASVALNTSEVPIAYPNPVHHTLSLSSRGTIAIYDALGREVLAAKNTSWIDVNKLPSGSYRYSLTTPSAHLQGSFIKE